MHRRPLGVTGIVDDMHGFSVLLNLGAVCQRVRRHGKTEKPCALLARARAYSARHRIIVGAVATASTMPVPKVLSSLGGPCQRVKNDQKVSNACAVLARARAYSARHEPYDGAVATAGTMPVPKVSIGAHVRRYLVSPF